MFDGRKCPSSEGGVPPTSRGSSEPNSYVAIASSGLRLTLESLKKMISRLKKTSCDSSMPYKALGNLEKPSQFFKKPEVAVSALKVGLSLAEAGGRHGQPC